MKRQFLIAFLGVLLVLAACAPAEEDTQEPTVAPPEPTVAPTATASATPATPATRAPTEPGVPPTATFPPTLTFTPSPTLGPPTGSPTPTGTPGPFEHAIRPGDDCISIVYGYGHVDLDVLQEFYELNEMTRCALGSPGQVVLVPRPTGQPDFVPEGATPMATSPFVGTPFFEIGQYCAESDDTLTSIALRVGSSPRQICEMNPLPDGLNCSGCDFSGSDVGSCPDPPLIVEGRCYNVPAPTPAPTGTQRPTGDETPTPTPTLRAPLGVYPVGGDTVSGTMRLQWVSVGRLQPDQYYVVNLEDRTAGTLFIDATRDTFIDVPFDYVPTDGIARDVVWWVSVQRQGEDGLFVPVGPRSAEYRFTWE